MDSKLKTPEPVMTGARQTMLTWARALESFTDVPAIFKAACSPLLGEIKPFPLLVYAPAIQNIRFPYTQKLLCRLGNDLYLWESVGGKIREYIYPLTGISQLEIGSILLNSWMSISGTTTEDAVLTTVIPFNTATLRHFLPFIQSIRPAAVEVGAKAFQIELSKFDPLASENFKFMSFARESLVIGQKVIETVWQPAIRRHLITVFGHSFDQITTLAHLLILTDTELILIRDDETSEENRGMRYGGVWYYLPLRHIEELMFNESENGRLNLAVIFTNGFQPLQLIFATANKAALQQVTKQFANLKNN